MNNTTVKNIVDYINEHQLCVLSSLTTDNKICSSTMYVGSDENLNLYFLTKKNTTKYRNIIANPYVSIAMHDENDLTTLQMQGAAYPIVPATDSKKAYELFISIRAKIAEYRLPISKIDAGEYEIFKAPVDHAVLSRYMEEDVTEGISKVEYNR